MQGWKVFACILLVASTFAAAQKAPSGSSDEGKVKDQITKLEQDAAKAFSNDDAKWFDAYSTPDFVLIDPDGKKWDRASTLADIPNYKVQSTISDVEVHPFGNTAVAIFKNNLKGTYKGQDISGETWESDVWVKQGGQWKMMLNQLTNVKKQ
jgi:ketosteroid isomerase-like protein